MEYLFDAGYNNGVMDGSQYLLDKLIEFRKEIREITDKRPLHIGAPPDLMMMAMYGGELPRVTAPFSQKMKSTPSLASCLTVWSSNAN
jgi:hypothetical protein